MEEVRSISQIMPTLKDISIKESQMERADISLSTQIISMV
jgi:hypothetical protein